MDQDKHSHLPSFLQLQEHHSIGREKERDMNVLLWMRRCVHNIHSIVEFVQSSERNVDIVQSSHRDLRLLLKSGDTIAVSN